MRFEICQDEDEVKGRVIAIMYLSVAVVLARTGKNEEPEPILGNKEEAMGSEACEGKQVYLEGYFDRLFPRLLPLLKECKASLTRLDLGTVFHNRDFPLQTLLNLLSKSVTDVGLPIHFEEDLNTLFDSKLHTRVSTLRLRFWNNHLDKGWKQLILNDSSSIRFFDCTVIDDKLIKPLQGLACAKPPPALTVLKIRFSINFNSRVRNPDTFANVANYLSSPAACNLVHFDVTFAGSREVEGAAMTDWEVANSLLNNFALCSFNFPFTDAAAESYAITLLRRNRLYRDSNLLNEPQVKPNVARLFLCGHGGVGKTTLRLALQPQHSWLKRSFTGMCYLSSGLEPTRGMETHYLSLQHPHKKLLICDLAGQEEFHVFHHYFMNAQLHMQTRGNYSLTLKVIQHPNSLVGSRESPGPDAFKVS